MEIRFKVVEERVMGLCWEVKGDLIVNFLFFLQRE